MRRKSTYRQSSAFLLVILLGMSVLVYHTAQMYVTALYEAQIKAKDDSTTKDKPSSEKQVYASPDVILSVSSIHLDQEFYQIKEIVFGKEEDSKDVPHVTEHYTSYFRTLFRQVISPNAP